MKNLWRLLRDESPLVVCPTLAVEVGIFEAILLQQIHYWLNPKFNKNYMDGKYWVYKTYDEWLQEFPFWSRDTLKRVLKSLKDQNLIEYGFYSEDKRDRTVWYTIKYDPIDASGEIPPMGSGENPPIHRAKSHLCNKEQRLHTEITTEITKQKQTCARDEPVDNFFDFEIEEVREVQIPKPPKSIPKSLQEEAFDRFWALYPNKNGKLVAKATFLDKKCYVTLPEILMGLESQILAKSEHDRLGLFHPDWQRGSRYLKERTWDDPPLTIDEIHKKAAIHHRSKMGTRERANVLASQGADQNSRELEAKAARNRLLALEENKGNV